MKKIFILSLLLATSIGYSQFHTTYDWEETRELESLKEKEYLESSIGILRKRIVEFKRSVVTDDIKVFETTHNIIRVNDEAGVARHSQIYIPMNRVKKLTSIKARTITKDGKIINLDENNIKKVENVEEYGNFQIFAIEGAEIGSEIEVLYTLEKEYSPFGNEMLQTDYPIQRVEMVFITNNLTGFIKTYNTDQNFERTYLENQLVEELVISNVLPIIEEDYSATDANKIYTSYQCFGNSEITQENLWGNTVQNIASGFFPAIIIPVVSELIKSEIYGGQIENLTEYKKVNLLENYIKSNFTVIENNNPQLEEINYILKNKSASNFGIIKAYAQFLKALEIDYEIVVTANRYTHRFDPEFYNPIALREFLIYLPTINQYIAPDRLDYRLGEAPTNILGNYGLFIDRSYEYHFSKIAQYDPEYSKIKRVMDIHFSKDFDLVSIDEKQNYTGHWAVLYRAIMTFYTGQDKSDVEDQLTGSGIEDKNTTKFEVENADMNQEEYNVPYIVNSTIESSALLEEAGDSYIFQLGKIIGIQSELYQERDRINPIEMQYPNQYNYVITVDIPKGYLLEGLESLVLSKKMEIEGNVLCQFDSSYEIKGDKLVVLIEEFYRVNDFPKESYEAFRNVINAASDFNKAAVLFIAK